MPIEYRILPESAIELRANVNFTAPMQTQSRDKISIPEWGNRPDDNPNRSQLEYGLEETLQEIMPYEEEDRIWRENVIRGGLDPDFLEKYSRPIAERDRKIPTTPLNIPEREKIISPKEDVVIGNIGWNPKR